MGAGINCLGASRRRPRRTRLQVHISCRSVPMIPQDSNPSIGELVMRLCGQGGRVSSRCPEVHAWPFVGVPTSQLPNRTATTSSKRNVRTGGKKHWLAVLWWARSVMPSRPSRGPVLFANQAGARYSLDVQRPRPMFGWTEARRTAMLACSEVDGTVGQLLM